MKVVFLALKMMKIFDQKIGSTRENSKPKTY